MFRVVRVITQAVECMPLGSARVRWSKSRYQVSLLRGPCEGNRLGFKAGGFGSACVSSLGIPGKSSLQWWSRHCRGLDAWTKLPWGLTACKFFCHLQLLRADMTVRLFQVKRAMAEDHSIQGMRVRTGEANFLARGKLKSWQ